MNRAQRTVQALFLTFTIAWSVINGVNENEGKGKNRENLVSLLEFYALRAKRRTNYYVFIKTFWAPSKMSHSNVKKV